MIVQMIIMKCFWSRKQSKAKKKNVILRKAFTKIVKIFLKQKMLQHFLNLICKKKKIRHKKNSQKLSFLFNWSLQRISQDYNLASFATHVVWFSR